MYHITETRDSTINSNYSFQLEVKEGLLGDHFTLWQNVSKIFRRTVTKSQLSQPSHPQNRHIEITFGGGAQKIKLHRTVVHSL